MNDINQSWFPNDFIDALTAELDRVQDTLRLKSVNRPLTYTVRDLSLDLQVFAVYDGDRVQFRTAQPNESGASKMTVTLGSITDRVVAETTAPPPSAGDEPIEDVLPELNESTRKSLRRLGVDSREKLRKAARTGARLETDHGEVNFAELAEQMDKARRAPRPKLKQARVVKEGAQHKLRMEGENLGEIMSERVRINGLTLPASISDDAIEVALPPDMRVNSLSMETRDGRQVRAKLSDT